MKNTINIAIFLILSTSVKAQEGMKFEHNIHWKDILEKAKVEKKYIFVDCYTTWCGPCKYMSKIIFPKPSVGKFFNDNYINVGFQIDSIAADNDEIKFQYEDAAFIKNKYPLQGYPTYLFFNSDGELVHKNFGSSNELEFIAKGTTVLDTLQQYYTQLKKYEQGLRDPIFLKKIALLALQSEETAATAKFAKEYISSSPQVLNNKDDIEFIFKTARTIRDTGFILIMNNLGKIEKVIEKKELFTTLKTIVMQSEFAANYLKWNNWDEKKWADYSSFIIKKYPHIGEEAIFEIKINAFKSNYNDGNFITTIEKYRVNHILTNAQLNDFAWNIFSNCSDKIILKRALKLSKASFENESKMDPNHIDTYANLLYKLGRIDEAIGWEKKAKILAIKNGADSNWGTTF